MKKAIFAFAGALLLALGGISGCCYDVPENGEFCFIIVPIFGAASDSPADTFSFEPVDCSLMR